MDLRDFLRLLARSWVLVVAAVLLGLVGASAYSLVKQPQYEATSKAYISTNATNNVAEFNQGNAAVQQIVKSYAQVALTPFVLDPVIRQLDLNESAAQLATRVSADSPTDTVVLEITASDRSAQRAADIANAVTQSLTTAVAALTDDAGTAAVVRVTRLQAATAPSQPSTPGLATVLAVGLLLGLAAGVALAMLRDRLDTKVRSVRDVEAVTSHALLGQIYFSSQAAARPLIELDGPQALQAEEYRTLRTNLQFVNFDSAARVLVVTSSIPSEGKSTTVANLGLVLASAGRRVLLIDGDLRQPKLADRFGLESAVGLTDVLVGSVELVDAVQFSRVGLDVLTSGPIPPNPTELLQSQSMHRLLEEVEESYDLVLIDSPPLLPVSDGAILSKLGDGAIVVCAANRVRRPQLEAAISTLDKVGADVLGVVATMLPRHGQTRGTYGVAVPSAHSRGASRSAA